MSFVIDFKNCEQLQATACILSNYIRNGYATYMYLYTHIALPIYTYLYIYNLYIIYIINAKPTNAKQYTFIPPLHIHNLETSSFCLATVRQRSWAGFV